MKCSIRHVADIYSNDNLSHCHSRDPSKTSVSDEPGTGEMEWPSFSVPGLYYKELSLDMPVGRGVKADECAFWGDFLEDLRLTLGMSSI